MESSNLAELRCSLLSAANKVDEIQQQMQEARAAHCDGEIQLCGESVHAASKVDEIQGACERALLTADERSRACERALLTVAAQSALRAARLSVDAIQAATGGAQAALDRAEATCDARTVAEALANVHDSIAPIPHASVARIDVRDALTLWCLSRVGHRNREAFEQSVEEAFRRPLTETLLASLHKAYWHRLNLVPGRFPSNNVLQHRRGGRRRRGGGALPPVAEEPEAERVARLHSETVASEQCITATRALFATSLSKIQGAISCMWATCNDTIDSKPIHDSGFARQTLAPEFGIDRVTPDATESCVLEVGIGSTAAVDLRGVVEAEGAVFAIFWSAKGDKLTPTGHYVSPARAAFLGSKRGDGGSVPSESCGIELGKNQGPIGHTTGNATRDLETMTEFGINKITTKAKDGGVLEIGFGPTE